MTFRWRCYDATGQKVISLTTPRQQTNLFVDVSIPVDIVEVEGPLELLSDRAPQQDGQSRHKVLVATRSRRRGSCVGDGPQYLFPRKEEEANLKLDGARVSRVKGIEQEVSVGAGICERQKRETVSGGTREARTARRSANSLGTSMWKELGVDLLEGFLVHDPTGTLLQRGEVELGDRVSITLKSDSSVTN